MSDKVIKRKGRIYSLKPFAFQYVEVDAGKNIIKGGGFYFLGKCFITVARCNNLWVDEKGKPYQFKKDGDILFLRKLAISFK